MMVKFIGFFKVLILILLPAGCFFFSASAMAQSPYLSINFSAQKQDGAQYFYFVNLCEPAEYSTKGGWFDNDTSMIDWNNISKEYLESFKCEELHSESSTSFSFSNQLMAYENILSILMVRTRNNTADSMRIVFPVKIKAFVTYVKLGVIPFSPGIYEVDDGIEYELTGMYLTLRLKKDYNWKPLKESNYLSNLIMGR